MQTSINRSKPYRDKYREARFKEAYGLDSVITVVNENDTDWNWVSAQLTFNHKDKDYILFEMFKKGSDNSTDYATLSYFEDDNEILEKFDTFFEAELALVELLKEKNG